MNYRITGWRKWNLAATDVEALEVLFDQKLDLSQQCDVAPQTQTSLIEALCDDCEKHWALFSSDGIRGIIFQFCVCWKSDKLQMTQRR